MQRNYYFCEACEVHWSDDWHCACNDRCPDCGLEIEPYEGYELEPTQWISE